DKGIALAKGNEVTVGMICLAIVLVGCAIILEGVATYGIVLGYIQYKNEVLNRAFVRVAGITSQYPFNAVEKWWKGDVRKPVLRATLLLFVCHALGSVALLIIASVQFEGCRIYLVGTLLVGVLFIFTLHTEYELKLAIDRVFQATLEPLPPISG
ncbi:MAG: hypothetical protein ACRD3J_28745, partial [Thermoanaerobaculia bacterium]